MIGQPDATGNGTQPEKITFSAFAALVGVNKSTVTRAVQKGRLNGAALTDDGRLFREAALAQWKENRDARTVATIKAPKAGEAEPAPSFTGELTQERIALARIQREEREIALKRLKGELLSAREVAADWTELARGVKQEILRAEMWADDLGAELGVEPKEARKVLRVKVQALLASIAKRFEALAAQYAAGDGGRAAA